jgi:hypothetical protein
MSRDEKADFDFPDAKKTSVWRKIGGALKYAACAVCLLIDVFLACANIEYIIYL